MNGLDAIVFTAGIGENSELIRKMVCKDMDFIGLSLDTEKNEGRINEMKSIESKNSGVKIFIIPTNEELEIAMQTYSLLK